MNKKNIEKSISRSLNQAPVPDFAKLVNLPYHRLEEHDFITRQEEKQSTGYIRQYTVVLSLCFALLLFIAGGWFYQYRLPSSMISLDINPSIEIKTNRHNQVLSVSALNEDAQKVLQNQDFMLEELDTAVASIVNVVIDQGYLNTDRNVILVSVENNSMEKAEILVDSLKLVIKKNASVHEMKLMVLSQTLKKDKAESEEAKELGVSVGKLKLLKKIEISTDNLTTKSLSHKSMSELLAIVKENEINLEDTIQIEESLDADSTVTPVTEDKDIAKDNYMKDQANSSERDGEERDENSSWKAGKADPKKDLDKDKNEEVDEQKDHGDKDNKINDTKAKENKAKENKAKENKAKENKVKENKVKENKVKEDKVQDNKVQDNKVQDNKVQDNKVQDDKEKDDKVKDDKAKDDKEKNDKAKEDRIKKKKQMDHLVDKQKENKADKNKTDKDYDASQDYDASEIDRIKSVKNENENGSH